jgi:hypothetical protein
LPDSTTQFLIIAWILIGVAVLPLTLWITAPFGRHSSPRFGPSISNRIGWLLMESPAIWWFPLVFLTTVGSHVAAAWVLAGMWMFHYVYRGLVFPFRIHTAGKQMPLLIVLFGFTFQLINGWFNGISLGKFGAAYTTEWLLEPRFWIGAFLFVAGWTTNFVSDEVLLNLRRGTETDYRIPYGKLFRWVSCPNFLGEMVQWCGWAVMCWNLAGLSFAVWTVANLLPRAIAHHRWYRQKFADYPPNRKAVIPGIL